MKVLITEDSLDSLLSIKISSDGGKTYTDYSVSSLKDNGTTFDCSPNDLKVICDANVLKYIQVLADGEKASSSDIDLSNYIKIKDIYVDFYKNPYYDVTLTDDEVSKLSGLDSQLYDMNLYKYYCSGNEFHPSDWSTQLILVKSSNNNPLFNLRDYFKEIGSVFMTNYSLENLDVCYLVTSTYNDYFSSTYSILTNARIHFIKHF